MRRRQIHFRLAEAEFRQLKSEATKAGLTVPVYARLRCLETLALADRLAGIERALAVLPNLPTGPAMATAFTRLAAKIDRAAGAQGGAK
ncbi:plasmid mobilization protein [Metallibacterium scheffleri]|uniref:Mobilization protein n=1 Tax=Metallibacterium scheffleri TaxID=993689 RepID=A0A4S3KMI5_9GAMM|nr:hypothetical protein [Metallibacterium scheffleri]THD09304.1 hypothetical protein B1806_11270 [Metallibacterium scheffleri]